MNVQEPHDSGPVSWKTILADTPVVSSDGDEVGVVHEVLGSEQEDIFHGIVVRSGLLGKDVMVPAERVGHLANDKIGVGLTAEEMRALEPFQDEESYRLGIVGLLRHRVGWVSEGRDPQ